MQDQYRKVHEAIKNGAKVQMAVALHTVIIGLGVRKLAVSDGLADLTGNELLSSRGRALVNREQELHIAQKVLYELLVKECQGRWCKTMDRPASSCGCPDCGSSLIDFPSMATPAAAPVVLPEPDVQLCAVEGRLEPVVRKTVGASPGRPLDLFTADTVCAMLATAGIPAQADQGQTCN